MRRVYSCLWVIPLLLAVGCSGSVGKNAAIPAVPPSTESTDLPFSHSAEANRSLWGLWEVRISADHQQVEIIPRRVSEMHFNVVRMLEVYPCTNCLTVSNVSVIGPNELTADLTLRHPFPGMLKLTAFDVRGVFITGADYLFPISGRSFAWGLDLPHLLNADGYTSLFNPTEFPETTPPALGYIPGKFAPGGDLTATLNGFVAYGRDAPRCMFEAGGIETRTVHLYVPDGPLRFGYAVDGCWVPVEEVVDPVTDFPPEANCPEPYRMVITGDVLPPVVGATVPIEVEVFDHQGLATVPAVAIESPQLFGGQIILTYSTTTGPDSFLFTGVILNQLGVGDGEYPVLVRAMSTEADPHFGVIEAWQVYRIEVREKKGWAVTWTGEGKETPKRVAIDPTGNICVAGTFEFTIDLDPGPLEDWREEIGIWGDDFVCKLDPEGRYLWGHSWGWGGMDRVYGIAVDKYGGVYVTGQLDGPVDFDPGPGVDEHNTNGDWDVYLTKFDANGVYQWVRCWGGESTEVPVAVATDNQGSVYVGGETLSPEVDFDPGPGTDPHINPSGTDGFLSKLDWNGNFQWARTWGSVDASAYCGGLTIDEAGNAYFAGHFSGLIDFDPGPDDDFRSTSGEPNDCDLYLSKFDTAGEHQWVRAWGGIGPDRSTGLSGDSSGNSYMIGTFQGGVDFDPGPGVDVHHSNDGPFFLTKFDSGGLYQWARNWGEGDSGRHEGVAADESGGVCIVGTFEGTFDLDPGPGVDEHTANGSQDIWLSKFLSNGDYLWGVSWGGTEGESPNGVTADDGGSSFVVGRFAGTIDFDPGPGTEWHTAFDADGFLSKFPPDGTW